VRYGERRDRKVLGQKKARRAPTVLSWGTKKRESGRIMGKWLGRLDPVVLILTMDIVTILEMNSNQKVKSRGKQQLTSQLWSKEDNLYLKFSPL
jgi:hypothetical protein